jgi:hypothetical protein
MIDIKTLIAATVADFIAKAEPFTAADIYNSIKASRTRSLKIKHGDISPIVRAIYSAGNMKDYGRTFTKDKIYLYHPTYKKQEDALNDHTVSRDIVVSANKDIAEKDKRSQLAWGNWQQIFFQDGME